jgi:hypothetical protein
MILPPHHIEEEVGEVEVVADTGAEETVEEVEITTKAIKIQGNI